MEDTRLSDEVDDTHRGQVMVVCDVVRNGKKIESFPWVVQIIHDSEARVIRPVSRNTGSKNVIG